MTVYLIVKNLYYSTKHWNNLLIKLLFSYVLHDYVYQTLSLYTKWNYILLDHIIFV